MWTLLISWLWQNKQLVLEIIGAAIIAGVIYWFGFHNPKVIKEQQAQIAQQATQIKAAQGAITLLGDIQEGKVKVDEKVQAQLTSVHHVVFKHHTTSVFLRAGRLSLPSVHSAGKVAR